MTWLLHPSRARRTGEWDLDGDASRRELSSCANDGIISSAAIIQGLLSAGATGREAVVGVVFLMLVGTITTAGAQYGEVAAERRAHLAIIEAERERLRRVPAEELAELVAHYEELGLTSDLARQVAEQLTAADPLRAQLDAEFDLEGAEPARYPYVRAAWAAFAFLLGSIGPFLLLLLMPWHVRGEVTLLAVVVSLVVSGFIGSRSEHSTAWITIARTVIIGLIVLGLSTLAGSLVTF